MFPDVASRHGPVGLALVAEQHMARVHPWCGRGRHLSLSVDVILLCGWTVYSLFTHRWSFVWFALWGYCKGCLCKHCFNRSFNVDVCVWASLLLGILTCWGYLPPEAERLGSRGPWTRVRPWRWGSDLVISVSPAPTEAQPRDRTNGDFWDICSLLARPPHQLLSQKIKLPSLHVH